eukprot:jgi/Astpho2/3756/fgenesh1_pg.00060_%23_56_t
MRLQHLLLTIGAALLSKGQGFLLRLTQLLSLKNSGPDSDSMLARMFSSAWSSNRTNDEGRVFVDRDPKHFRLILNFLRDGTAALPSDPIELQEIKQEAEFFQLEDLKQQVVCHDHWKPQGAAQLRSSIAQCVQGDKQLREAMDVILECAFGSIPYTDSTCVPSSSTCVDVALRESAYNPLHPQHQLQQQDETLVR